MPTKAASKASQAERRRIYAEPAMTEEINLEDYIKLLRRHKWGIIGILFLATLIGILTALSMQRIYTSFVTLLIEPDTPKIVSMDPLEGRTNIMYFYETQYEIIRSRTVAREVIKRLSLQIHPDFSDQPSTEDKGFSLQSILHPDFKKLIPAEWLPLEPGEIESSKDKKTPMGKIITNFQKRLSVKGREKSQVVTISFESSSPELSAKIANTIAKVYVETGMESRLAIAKQATSWLTGRLGELRKQLADSEDALQKFQKQAKIFDSQSQQNIIKDKLANITGKLIQAQADRVKAETMYNQVLEAERSGKNYESLRSVLEHPLLQKLNEEQSRLQRRYVELSERYGAKHPKMIAAKSDIREADRRLKSEIKKVVNGIKKEYEVAVNNEKELALLGERIKKGMQELKGKEFQLAKLEREVEANRQLYNMFLTRFKETDISGKENVTNVRVIDPAEPPVLPSKPRKRLIVLGYMIVGLIFGVLFAFVKDSLDKTFKNAEDVERVLKIPALGALYTLKKERSKELVPEQYGLENPQSAFAESVNNIRTGVLFSNIDYPPHIIVVTSAVPGEGKTTLSSNLAASLSKLGNTLLIDADLRKPGLAKIFNIHKEEGLTGLISGQCSASDTIFTMEKTKGHFHILPCGKLPINPLEFLSSEKFKFVLRKLKEKFDYIVIDTAPVLPYSDAIAVSSIADEIILLVKADDTPHNIAIDALKRMNASNVTPLGVVLSQVNPKYDTEGYGGYYNYYNQYAHENAGDT